MVQFSSIGFGFGWKQAFRGGTGALVELLADGQREAGDFAVASHRGLGERGIVFMRGNDSKNASRVKSYGRFLDGFYAWLRNGDFLGFHTGTALPPEENASVVKRTGMLHRQFSSHRWKMPPGFKKVNRNESVEEAELTTDCPDFTDKKIPIREISEIRGYFVGWAFAFSTKRLLYFSAPIFLPRI